MSDLIFVENENSSIVDDWMVGTKSTSTGNFDASKVLDAKGGLGFKGDTKKVVKNDDAFAKQLDKNKNKKGKRDRDEENSKAYEPSHGMVEDMEESRTSLGGGFVRKSIVKANKHKLAEEAKKAAELTKINAAVEVAPVISAPTTPVPSSTDGEFKVKRTKTRSKQKNIRRDNRSNDDKPESLQVGHWKYMGRPLTKETKSILGIVKPPPTAPAAPTERTGGKKNRNKNKKDAAAAVAAGVTSGESTNSVQDNKTGITEEKASKKAKTDAK